MDIDHELRRRERATHPLIKADLAFDVDLAHFQAFDDLSKPGNHVVLRASWLGSSLRDPQEAMAHAIVADWSIPPDDKDDDIKAMIESLLDWYDMHTDPQIVGLSTLARAHAAGEITAEEARKLFLKGGFN